MQTIWGPLFRRDRLRWRRERVTTSDDDFVDLDWAGAEARPDAPLLLILHGLEGSSRSHYAVGLAREALARGWRAVVLNFRSCSGELNRRPQFYHSGHTDDLDDVVRVLVGREPAARLGAVGISLGGNVLLKWLGEREAKVPAQFVGAVGISVPFELAPCARALDQGFRRRVYAANFLRTMRAKAERKAARDPDFATLIDLPNARRARTFAEYDRAVTAPLNGFADETDYWTKSSSQPFLKDIRVPVLLVHAEDDPFFPARLLPREEFRKSDYLKPLIVPAGGHVGFVTGAPWRWEPWLEKTTLDFLGGR